MKHDRIEDASYYHGSGMFGPYQGSRQPGPINGSLRQSGGKFGSFITSATNIVRVGGEVSRRGTKG